MKIYNFHNKQYGIGMRLELDKKRGELIYQCFSIKHEYLGKFYYEHTNGWMIESVSYPVMDIDGKTLWLQGSNNKKDDYMTIINYNRYCCGSDGDMHFYVFDPLTYRDIVQIYNEIIDVLKELHNDLESQGLLFLDM